MFLLGIDLGTSSIKVSVVNSVTGKLVVAARYPDEEVPISSPQKGWAEQDPVQWWTHVQAAIQRCHASGTYDPAQIKAIGIAYQMHGLVLVDREQNVLYPSIIWCDSRAVEIGEAAYTAMGAEWCQSCLLNSPGNFTASKLAWIKTNRPEIYKRIDKIMLPGDFIAMKLTGQCTTTPSALSEGIFWDFAADELSTTLVNHFGFSLDMFPHVQPVFSVHGTVTGPVAALLRLPEGTPVGYKAGDQLNNALSLNVMQPGEVAATAGTSGVIYAVTDKLFSDKYSRVNAFAHVNHTRNNRSLGVLLCINGVGIMNRWVRDLCGETDYVKMNMLAAGIAPGANGLLCIPFGNGAERMLENKIVEAHFLNLDLNTHTKAHMFRAIQEGIAFAFRYGLDIMRENGLAPTIIRAGRANMFLSDLFTECFVNATGVPVELYETDGSLGAAIGAGLGTGVYIDAADAFRALQPIERVDSDVQETYETLYQQWKNELNKRLK